MTMPMMIMITKFVAILAQGGDRQMELTTGHTIAQVDSPCAVAEDVINAVQSALEFDDMAGLDNNLNKFTALSTTAEGKEKLKK